HTRFSRDWSSDVCSSDLQGRLAGIRMRDDREGPAAGNLGGKGGGVGGVEHARPYNCWFGERKEAVQASPEAFISTRPETISTAARTRSGVTASPSATMPTRKAPIAPIPVHTV